MNEEEWADKEDRIKDEKAENTPSDMEVIDAMERLGGSFVKALAGAARAADYSNRRTIKQSFYLIWGKYVELAKNKKTLAIFKPFGGKPLWGLTIGNAYGVIEHKDGYLILEGCDVRMPDEEFEIKY